MIFYLLLTIFFILFDEFIMALTQHRTGPYIGFYGIISAIVNAFNLILIATIRIPKTHFYLKFTKLSTWFLLTSLLWILVGFPLFIADLYVTIIILFVLSSISILLIILATLSMGSKYSILGSFRIATQLISFHLIFTTIFILMFSLYDSLTLIFNFYLPNIYIINLCFHVWFWDTCNVWFHSIHNLNFILLFILSFISLLAESNRVPFDLPEAESELVAGFLTDFSSIYFSVILLTEYANILNMAFVFIVLYFVSFLTILLFIYLICISRSLFSRLRFDSSISYFWTSLLPTIFALFLLFLTSLFHQFHSIKSFLIL